MPCFGEFFRGRKEEIGVCSSCTIDSRKVVVFAILELAKFIFFIFFFVSSKKSSNFAARNVY